MIKTAVPAVPTRLEMLNAKQVDAALLPEPYATLALNDGGTALCSATGIGLYPSVIAFPKQAIDGLEVIAVERIEQAIDRVRSLEA